MARISFPWKRGVLLGLGDALLLALALYLAFLIRFEGKIPQTHFSNIGFIIIVALTLKIPIFYLFRLYRMSWAYVSFHELLDVFKAVTLSSIALGTFFFLWGGSVTILPRSVLMLDYLLTLFLIGAFAPPGEYIKGGAEDFTKKVGVF
jgi:FlaA1/EpsC-like NDP-sugar epimerase